MKFSQKFGAGLTALALIAIPALAAHADGETKVGGKMYADFTVRSTDGDNGDDGYGIDVKRFYFGVDHKFDDTWSADLTTDFHYDSADGRTSLFVKKAYIQANLNDMATVRIGSADLPWVGYVEHAYGLRYLENVLIDRAGFGTSADWGIHLLGANSKFDYQVSVVNGNGYKNPDRSKTMDFSARVGFHPVENLTLALGARSGKLGQDSELQNTVNTAKRFDALAAWKGEGYRAGIEYFTADNFSKTAVVTGPSDSADGYSLFTTIDMGEKTAFFVRYDQVNPSKDLASDTKDTYYNLGMTYHARKNVDFAFAYKRDEFDTGASKVKANEFGVWAQVKF